LSSAGNKVEFDRLKSIKIPIITEYDTYMSPASFCIKNYKKFVFEYLEADGKYFFLLFFVFNRINVVI
jgi:hypothetical protein